MTDEQKAKLPKRAQSYIRKLEADVKHWKAEAGHRTGDSLSPVYVWQADGNMPLSPNARVAFRLSSRAIIGVQLSDGDHLRISKDSFGVSGSYELAVRPVAANVITVR